MICFPFTSTDYLYMTSESIPVLTVALTQPDQVSITKHNFFDFVIDEEDSEECLSPNKVDLISTPHSNAFLDFNGDCAPDIILSRIKQVSYNEYFPYYEIYLQKIQENFETGEKEVKYCLTQTEQSLTGESFESLEQVKVPLVQYVDINLSGMPDIIFYYDGKIYTIYNHLQSKAFDEGTLDDA